MHFNFRSLVSLQILRTVIFVNGKQQWNLFNSENVPIYSRKYWANCRTLWPIFITLVLLPIYFVYSSVSIYRIFTRFIRRCPAWLAVYTPLIYSIHLFIYLSNVPVYILFLIWFNYLISQAGDVSAYIPTNVISITDGQVCVSTITLQDMLINYYIPSLRSSWRQSYSIKVFVQLLM